MSQPHHFLRTVAFVILLTGLSGCAAGADGMPSAPAWTSTPEARTATPAWTATVTPETAKLNLTPTPTETNPYTLDKLSVIPTSKEDLAKLMQVPNPVEDKAGFVKAMKEILKVLDSAPSSCGDNALDPQKGRVGVNNALNATIVTQDICPDAAVVYRQGSGYGLALAVPVRNSDGTVFHTVILIDGEQENLFPYQSRTLDDILTALKDGGGRIVFMDSLSADLFLQFGVDPGAAENMSTDFAKMVYSTYQGSDGVWRMVLQSKPVKDNTDEGGDFSVTVLGNRGVK